MEQCIFCEKELGLLQKRKLHCGDTWQPTCDSCFEKYNALPFTERTEAVLETGRAKNIPELKEYLRSLQSFQAQAVEEQKQKDARRRSALECLRCGQNMADFGPLTVKLGEERYFFSDLHRLASGSLRLHIFRCPSCGKVEFFLPDPKELEMHTQENEV